MESNAWLTAMPTKPFPTRHQQATARPVPGTGRVTPPVHRPQAPAIIIPKMAPVPLPGRPGFVISAPGVHFPKPFSIVQPKMAGGLPKFYPNLNPAAAAVKADPAEFLKLESTFDQSYFRMRRGGDHGLLVPNSRYDFVRTTEGQMVMHPRYRHPVLAQGKPVLYAGEASFNNGKLDWWSNGSGNYRPDSDHAEQAALPMARFFTYEQVLKGAHKQ